MNSNPNDKEIKIEKIKIISEIDQLEVIANNQFLMKKYTEAIRICEKIIRLAQSVDLKSIIKEQEDFIIEINSHIEDKQKITHISEDFDRIEKDFEDLISKDEIEGAHAIIQTFKQKYAKIYNLDLMPSIRKILIKEENIWNKFKNTQDNVTKQLEPLQIQINSYLATNNILLATETLNKATTLIKDLKDDKIRRKWETLKARVQDLNNKISVTEKIENTLNEIASFTDTYNFDKAKSLLDSMLELTEKEDLPEYKKKIISKMKSTIDAEQKYKKLLDDIKDLEEFVKKNLSKGLFEEALKNCEQIVKISRFIGKSEYANTYSQFSEDIKQKIRQYNRLESVKLKVKSLNFQGLDALGKGEFSEALERYKEIRSQLRKFFD